MEQSKIDKISMIQLAWRSADELNKITLQQIQNEYKVFAMKCQADVQKVKENAEAEKQIELEKVRAEFTTNGGDSNGSYITFNTLYKMYTWNYLLIYTYIYTSFD